MAEISLPSKYWLVIVLRSKQLDTLELPPQRTVETSRQVTEANPERIRVRFGKLRNIRRHLAFFEVDVFLVQLLNIVENGGGMGMVGSHKSGAQILSAQGGRLCANVIPWTERFTKARKNGLFKGRNPKRFSAGREVKELLLLSLAKFRPL